MEEKLDALLEVNKYGFKYYRIFKYFSFLNFPEFPSSDGGLSSPSRGGFQILLLRWNLKNLSRGLNPPKLGLN